MNNLLLAYAMDFSSFLVQNMEKEDLACINQIIVFGSAARGSATSKSDVDIFVNTQKRLESKIKRILSKFYESELYNRYWRLLGINNEINLIVGDIRNWKELQSSILSDGIVIYGKYSGHIKSKENFVVLWWESIKPEYKRVMISKQLYGWRLKKKEYKGLLEKAGGEKIGSNAVLVPVQGFAPINELFKKHRIKHMLMYVSAVR